MPEGDALHRAARRLQPLVGERVEVETPNPRGAVERLAERLDGRRLLSVGRSGKNLLLHFEGGYVLHSHLRMNGRWTLVAAGHRAARTAVARPPRLEASRRGSGTGPCSSCTRAAIRRLGPDILDAPPRPRRDASATSAATDQGRGVGDALLDQRLVAGIGNKWKAEALWEARALALAPARRDERRRAARGSRGGRALMRARSTGCRAGTASTAGSAARARAAAAIRSRGQGDDNRIAYWCPGCQAGQASAPSR